MCIVNCIEELYVKGYRILLMTHENDQNHLMQFIYGVTRNQIAIIFMISVCVAPSEKAVLS